jgi:hypothetical protein
VTTRGSDFRLRDIAVAAYVPSAVSSIGYGPIMPVLALRARALGADVSTAAFVVALWPLGMLATSLPAGAVVARLGERTTLLIAGLVDAVAMVGAVLATTVWQLGLCGDIGNSGGPLLVSAVAAAAPLAAACLAIGALGLLGTGWVGYWTHQLDVARAIPSG